MTLNEFTVLIASQLGKELDDPFKQMIAKRIQYWRGRLIKNSVDKDQRERRFFKQVINIKMVTRDEVLCQVPYTQCKIAATQTKVPKPLRANSILFDYVGAINGMTSFKETTAASIPFLMKGKFSKHTIYYTYENDLIKVYGNAQLPIIRLEGIFDNPEDAAKLNCENTDTFCNFWDEEYPVTNDIAQLIVQSIMEVDFRMKPDDSPKQIPVVTDEK